MNEFSRLTALGWDDWFQQRFEDAPGIVAGRVAVQHKGTYLVLTADGERWAQPAGRLFHSAAHKADLPVVGDWVGVRGPTDSDGQIVSVVERKTRFSRLEAGSRVESASDAPTRTQEQVVAANLDTVIVVASATQEFNVRRIDRYLTMIFEGGAMPVVMINKSDLRDPIEEIEQLAMSAPGVEVWPCSALTGEGLAEFERYLAPGRTIALVGSSGVGKTSIVNALVGDGDRRVMATRGDSRDRGRHTTTHRELIQLSSGGMIIDTPGMRELHLWNSSDGLDQTFDDITQLAETCRFSDCEHRTEPGCAVKQALEDGTLSSDRYASYQKLMRELAHLERKQDPRLEREARDRWKSINKQMRKRSKR